MFMGIEECPTCRECSSHSSEPPKSVAPPGITPPHNLPSQEQSEAASASATLRTPRAPLPRIMPTICLDCGQSFIGGDRCPLCEEDNKRGAHALLEEPEIVLPDEAVAEEVIEARVLLEEMRKIGFEITQSGEHRP